MLQQVQDISSCNDMHLPGNDLIISAMSANKHRTRTCIDTVASRTGRETSRALSSLQRTTHVNLVVVAAHLIIIQWNPSIPDTLAAVLSDLIKGGVLISGVLLYTSLCSWDHV